VSPHQIAIRLAVVAAGLTFWFGTQRLIGRRKMAEGAIGDRLHDLTRAWNDRLHARPRVVNALLIVSSAFIDLFALFLIGAGLFGETLRPFVGLALLFLFRQLCQALCALPPPPGMIWRRPGFPSLLVTYGVSSDFFISGHTAVAVLGAIEAFRLLPVPIAVAAGVIAGLEALLVIVLRAHYTLDVLGALTAAVTAAVLASEICARLGV